MRVHFQKGALWGLAVFSWPVVSLSIIHPEWLGRMIGLFVWFVGIPLFLLIYPFIKKSDYLYGGSPLYRSYGKKRIDSITRIIVLLFALLCIKGLSLSFIQDTILVINGEAPRSRTSLVTQASGTSLAGLIDEDVVLDEAVSSKENSFSAWFFSPRHIMQGNKYEFLYLPTTHLILEARPIK